MYSMILSLGLATGPVDVDAIRSGCHGSRAAATSAGCSGSRSAAPMLVQVHTRTIVRQRLFAPRSGCHGGSAAVQSTGCTGGRMAPMVIVPPQPMVGPGPTTVPPPVGKVSVAIPVGAVESLAEVNRYRVARGLRPFIADAGLSAAAASAAVARAAVLSFGHTRNDFVFVPAGTTAAAAGCGADAPGGAWLTCCTYDAYTYAGAAYAIGADGKRYMHLFVR